MGDAALPEFGAASDHFGQAASSSMPLGRLETESCVELQFVGSWCRLLCHNVRPGFESKPYEGGAAGTTSRY